jgi:hypothetical protein
MHVLHKLLLIIFLAFLDFGAVATRFAYARGSTASKQYEPAIKFGDRGGHAFGWQGTDPEDGDAALASLEWFNLTVVPMFNPDTMQYFAVLPEMFGNASTYVVSAETRAGQASFLTLPPSCPIGTVSTLPFGLTHLYAGGVAQNGNVQIYTLTVTRACPVGYYCIGNDALPLCPSDATVCENDGICVSGPSTTVDSRCICRAGFSGVRCQTDIDECASEPCVNGATCLDKLNGYLCSCGSGFFGTTCQLNISGKSPSPSLPDAPNNNADNAQSQSEGATVGALAGFATAGIIVAILLVAIVFYLVKQREARPPANSPIPQSV